VLVAQQDEVIVLSDKVLFDFNSSILTLAANQLLAEISVLVKGHTDSVGSDV
jgi:outer membrane protein OmpA-like peptidoglycan-associated protein